MPTLKQDSIRVQTLVELAWQKYDLSDTTGAQVAIREALAISQTLNYANGLALADMFLGTYHNRASRYKQAITHFDSAKKHYGQNKNSKGVAAATAKAGISLLNNASYAQAIKQFNESLTIYRRLQDTLQIANNLMNAGIAYEGMGDYTKALNLFFECLRLDETLNNTDGIASDYDQISIIYKKQKAYAQAEIYQQKAIDLYRQTSNEYGLASSLNNLGILYKAIKRYVEAETVYEEAEKLFIKINNKRGQVAVLNNMGELYQVQNKPAMAMDYFSRSLSLGEQIQFQESLLSNWEGLAKVYTTLGRADDALQIALKGLSLAESLHMREYVFKFHQLISQAYKTKKDYASALLYLEKSVADNDSLYTSEKTRQILELQTRYETEKKEQQIALLNKDAALQKSELNSKTLLQHILLFSIAALLLMSYLIFHIYQAKAESRRFKLADQLKMQQLESEKLTELHALKSRFFSNIAHEFRTPLTLILGPVESLIDKYGTTGREADLLHMVKNNASRLLSLINQLLELSKIESGVVHLELKQEDVVGFLKGITYSFLSLAEQKSIEFFFNCQVESLIMDYDTDKLEKIMSNLLGNAFKFTPEGGKVEVRVAMISRQQESGQSFLQISVTDSGIGIPASQLPFVFDRFFQASNGQVRDVEGSGIGLSLTKELVEAHGGSIAVKSDPEKGTAFTFDLPVTNTASLSIHALPGSKVSISQPARRQVVAPVSATENDIFTEAKDETLSEIVLVIEDNEEVRRFIGHALAGSYQVIEAVNGTEGIQKALDVVPDLIISDVMMPGMDGYETCRQLKAEERTSHIPVILLTAKAGLESKLEGLERGADDYLSKPFNTQELKARIKNLITLRRKLQSKYLSQTIAEPEEQATAIPPIENTFLTRLKEVVYAHLSDESFSIEQLSSEMAMSRTQVHRKLKALTNQSASEFMRILRLEKAKELLLAGRHNVSETAYLTGFNSATYFSTCFAHYYGYAPSELKVKS